MWQAGFYMLTTQPRAWEIKSYTPGNLMCTGGQQGDKTCVRCAEGENKVDKRREAELALQGG